MPCPYFCPTKRLEARKRVPLGDLHTGVCRADPADAFQPAEKTVRELCNLGYARGKCERFPGGGPDAVRFCVSSDRYGLIRLHWVVEKDHHPFGHGPLEYSRETGAFTVLHSDAVLQKQAEAYLEAYLRRKPAAAHAT